MPKYLQELFHLKIEVYSSFHQLKESHQMLKIVKVSCYPEWLSSIPLEQLVIKVYRTQVEERSQNLCINRKSTLTKKI